LGAFFFVEGFKEGSGQSGANLLAREAEEKELFGTVIENGDGTPVLGTSL
jgi:hypothetical protein